MTKQVCPRKTTSAASSAVVQRVAEHAPLDGAFADDVGEPPGAPQMIHENRRMSNGDRDVADRRSIRLRRDRTGHRRRCRRRRRRRVRLPVDQLLQLLAGLEVRHLLRRHIHLVAGLGIASLARLAPPQAEAAESAQLDLLAAMQRVDDALEHRVDDDLGVLLGEVRHARDFLDQLRLRHAAGVHESLPSVAAQLSSSSAPSLAGTWPEPRTPSFTLTADA